MLLFPLIFFSGLLVTSYEVYEKFSSMIYLAEM